MVGIGFGEMIIIAGIALVVIGPEKFPEFAKIVMRTIRDVRGYVEDAKQEISKELKPVQNEIREVSRYNPEDYIDALTGTTTQADEDVETEGPGASIEPTDDPYGESDPAHEEPDTYGPPEDDYGIDENAAPSGEGAMDDYAAYASDPYAAEQEAQAAADAPESAAPAEPPAPDNDSSAPGDAASESDAAEPPRA